MKYIFSETGRRVLEALTFTKALYAFDFDGTLAPIVKSPENARLSKELVQLIRELSLVASVAVISGRAVDDLKSRLGFDCEYVIGNHGLEGPSTDKKSCEVAWDICQKWRDQLSQNWGALENDPCVFVEDKNYSLALHYRKSRNKKFSRMELFSKIENLNPLPRIILGKSIINLVPSGSPHKGVALLELMSKLNLNAAMYVGDDDTDEDVFSLPDETVIGVRVGQKASSQAKFFVKRQAEVKVLVRELLNKIQSHRDRKSSL